MAELKDIKFFKVTSLSTALVPNALYFVLKPNTIDFDLYVTDLNGIPVPISDSTTTGSVLSVTGTGVSGTPTNPKVDISTFVSSQLNNQVYLSLDDGKLQVNPITSPNDSLEVNSTNTELQLQLSTLIQNQINSALQPGANISELVNDAGYVTIGDLDGTDLTYTPSTTNGTINSSTGTDATIPLAGALNAGLISPSEKASVASAVQPEDLATVATTGEYADLLNSPKTKSEFNAKLTDGDFLFVGDITQYTNELAQDAVGAILTDTDTIDLNYDDVNNNISADVKLNSIDASHLADDINISEFVNDVNYLTNVDLISDNIINNSTVLGTTVTEALSNLNTDKANDSDVLHKSGNETKTGILTLSNQLRISSGTATNPSILFPNENASDTGINHNTDGQVQFVTNGVINSTVDGVGYRSNSFRKIGGLSSEFLKADGSSDNTVYENIANKGVVNGYASLGADGKVPNSQIPALAISETFPVASEAAMLALSSAEQGDVAVRTDISKSFILTTSPASTLENWQELLTPTDAVQSVNGQTGNVNLTKSDVGLGNIDNTSDLNKPISTATENALELKTTVSAGAVSGFALTNNGNGTVNISSGIVYLRATNDPYADIIKYPISAVTNLALTDDANNYVLVDYNGGSPTITVTTNASTINTQTNSIAYVIARVGNDLEYLNLVGQNVDPNAKIRVRFLNQEGIRRASGAVLGFSNRNLTLTSGVLFSGLIRVNSAAFNTASTDTFTLVYNNGSTWTRTTGQTQVNNTQYNVSGVLTTMPNNTFRTDYVYLLPNNPSKLYVVMGTTTYGSLTLAKGAPRPLSLPVELQVLGLEVGRLFIEKNSTAIAEVQSSFANEFVGAAVPEHNSLSGLQGGAAGEYNHLTNTQVNLVNNRSTSTVVNESIVSGLTTTDALNVLNDNAIKDTYIISAMGDSMTANGTYLNELNSLINDPDWQIKNMGISGGLAYLMNERFSEVTNSSAKYVLILGGVNDISQDQTEQQIKDALQAMYTKASTAGIQVVAMTIVPFGNSAVYTVGKETIRNNVNNWIKNNAIDVDYVVDIASVLEDPLDVKDLNPVYDSGDGLHPNTAGYELIANTVFSQVVFVKGTTDFDLKIAKDITLNQDLGTFDDPTFRNLNVETIYSKGTNAVNSPSIFASTGARNNPALVVDYKIPTQAVKPIQVKDSNGSTYFNIGVSNGTGGYIQEIYPQSDAKHGLLIKGFTAGYFSNFAQFENGVGTMVWKVGQTGLTSMAGIGNNVSFLNSQILTGLTGLELSRNVADNNFPVTSQQKNIGSGGQIHRFWFGAGNFFTGAFTKNGLGIGSVSSDNAIQVQKPISGLGTISVSAGSGTVTGVNTNFQSFFKVGQTLTANGETRTISAISSATSMTTDNWTNTASGVGYTMPSSNVFRVDFNGDVRVESLTGNTLTAVGANKEFISLPTSTYPSFTELSFVKGVTSSIQEQIDNKLPLNNPTPTGVLNLSGTPDTNATSTHYFVENANIPGAVQPKTLANVRAEIVTEAAIDAAKPNIALTTNTVNLSGNQTIVGRKTFDNGTSSPNIISTNSFINGTATQINNTVEGFGLAVQNSALGIGVIVQNSSQGVGQRVNSPSGGQSYYSDISGSSKGFVSNGSTTSTGYLYEGLNDGVTSFSVDKFGNTSTNLISQKVFTVATLPTPNPTSTAYSTVSDATSPTYLSPVVGGGSVVCPVFYNGAAWVCH